MGKRTQQIILSIEGLVLKDLRVKYKLSMRAAGAKIGFSDSYISQIENGRADPPIGETLLKFLKLYGDITPKYFGELCRYWHAEKTDADYLHKLIGKLKPEQLKLVRAMTEQLAKGF